MTFNYNSASGQILENQNYKQCIRQEEGYCGITYSAIDFELAPIVATPTTEVRFCCSQIFVLLMYTVIYVFPFWRSISTHYRKAFSQ